MDKTLKTSLEKLLDMAECAAAQAEVFYSWTRETPVIFEANRLKQLQTNEGVLVALRIVREGRVGFSTATTLSDMESLVSRAVEVSQFGAPARFELPSRQAYPEVAVYDPEVDPYDIEQMVALGEAMISKVRDHTPAIQCDASVDKSTSFVCLLNSRGAESHFDKSFFGVGLEGNLIRDRDMLFVGDRVSSCHPVTEADSVVSAVIRQLELSQKQASVSTGRLPVIFLPHGVASALVAPLSVAFNGRMVVQGVSPLVNKVGERVFSDKLSIWDDATIDYRPRSRPCDDEGVYSRRLCLVQGGIIGEFLYDLQTAVRMSMESTGSADRSGGLPAPSISSLAFSAGNASFDDMIKELKEGLVVEQLMGASQTNILGGDFSGNVLLGYKVENGEIVGRVKDTVVSGNIYEALNRVVAVGEEGRWVGAVFTPPILCADLAVGSKSK